MPLTPTSTREQLAKLGHAPKRFLGQNFLVDGNIVRKSLELAEVRAGDAVIEIGPGLGTLTTALLEAGAEVWAVEKDRTLHAHLSETLAPRFPQTFHLLEADAVDEPLAGFDLMGAQRLHLAAANRSDAEAALPRPVDCKIVANLPYAIATPWLDAVLSGPLPQRMILMLQLEAAQRYAARPGTKSFGAISVFLQSTYDVAPGHTVAAACFYPRPDVESHLLHLVRKPQPFVFPAEFKAIVRACFQQRRKRIGSLLRRHATGEGWRELLRADGLSEEIRPEALPADWWRRFALLRSNSA